MVGHTIIYSFELFKTRRENTRMQGYGIHEKETLSRSELESLLE